MSALNPERWANLWRAAAKTMPPPDLFEELVAKYAESHRHYHNQQHIGDCLAEFDQVNSIAKNPIAVELAIWFHDVIYNPRATDNEERSAELARSWLKEFGADETLADAVGCLVLATKHHNGSLYEDAPLLVDVDLSILGQQPERFLEYEWQIREEYLWVDEKVFATKRAEILQSFLARERIFQTDFFFQRLEVRARENLKTSVQRLRATPMD